MTGTIASLYRHPIKGFTPERLEAATLTAGAYFPCDRIYAVEDGPSGFDPEHPAFVSKTKFTVLAKLPHVARARTRYDEASGQIRVSAPGMDDLAAVLTDAKGRKALADWLALFLGEDVRGPLNVLPCAPDHRFTDDPTGHVSIINLASVRDLEARLGVPIDPLRFRANIYVEGWPAWWEMDQRGRALRLGGAVLEVTKPIIRCAATHVDPGTGLRDLDLVKALFDAYGHQYCGVYAKIVQGGVIAQGDPC
jgi:hypothetical protein